MPIRRAVAVCLLMSLAAVWATPCPSGPGFDLTGPPESGASDVHAAHMRGGSDHASEPGASSHHGAHSEQHGTGEVDTHTDRVADALGLWAVCPCGCQQRANVAGVSISPGWALCAPSEQGLAPGEPIQTPALAQIPTEALLEVPTPVPLPS